MTDLVATLAGGTALVLMPFVLLRAGSWFLGRI